MLRMSPDISAWGHVKVAAGFQKYIITHQLDEVNLSQPVTPRVIT